MCNQESQAWPAYDLSTIGQPIDALVQHALDFARQLQSGVACSKVLLPPQLVQRGTTREPRAAARSYQNDNHRQGREEQSVMMLGVIADDYTGATDVASMLVRAGMRTTPVFGVSQQPLPSADAVVIALKSRTMSAPEAVAQALEDAGARQFPENGSTAFQGHLFVGDALLSESGLGVRNIRIGPTICPGGPRTQMEGAPLLLALKSGNLGGPDFFAQALAMVH